MTSKKFRVYLGIALIGFTHGGTMALAGVGILSAVSLITFLNLLFAVLLITFGE